MHMSAICAHSLEQLEGGHAPQHVVAEQVLSENLLIQGFCDVFGGICGSLAQLSE